ncbi:unnamed protein product [Rhizoctonia solani]|uniref:Glucanase n=1 Tax=Rhizoctonia solani TaxID=456999 RepID=A0A8H2WGP1_9AGAM|nr:unnamed protein product [Rhizoctonia solani]
MDKSFQAGVVLVMSIWDDHAAHMLWLDSNYPLDRDPSQPGVARGTCSNTSGSPQPLEIESPNASVTFSNIRFGDIGSTYASTGTTTTSSAAPGTTTSPSGTVPHYGQCGGQGWSGPTWCVSPYTCTYLNQWHSQCL